MNMGQSLHRVRVTNITPEKYEIIFDFDNDRHHSVMMCKGDPRIVIVDKLMRLAAAMRHDKLLDK